MQSVIRQHGDRLYLLIIEGIHLLGQGLGLLGIDEHHNVWFVELTQRGGKIATPTQWLPGGDVSGE